MDLEIEDAVTTEETKPAEPAPQPQIDEQSIYRIVQEAVRGLSQQPSAQRRSELDGVVKEMLEEGVPERAIRNMLRLNEARHIDRSVEENHRHAAIANQNAFDSFMEVLWSSTEESLLKYEGRVPSIRKAIGGLAKDVSDLIEKHPELAEAKKIIHSGRKPAQKWFDKAAELAIDKYCKDEKLTKSQDPVDLKSSKPTPTEKEFDVEGLEPDMRRMYLAIVSSSGKEELGRKAVENMRKVTRGK
jgi:hypothetical protein